MAHNPMGKDPTDSENDPIFNATTQKRNVVDPRTGLFEVYVPLPSIIGNSGNGPVIDMSLHNTPVVNNEAALGDGWFYSLTTYSENHKKLTLHSGEVLAVEKNQTLMQSSVMTQWDAGKLIVRRRGGRKEVLTLLPDTGIYVPESLTTDGYNSVTLSWMTTHHVIDGKSYYQIQLTEIKDATRTLLKVQYAPGNPQATPVISSATLTFWPDDAAETLCYTLAIEDYALKSVSLGTRIKSSFEYLDHPTCGWLLTRITTFDGLQEQVDYKDNGLTFPDNPKLSALPCVSTHTLIPNGGGTPVITTYVYQRQDPNNYQTIMSEGMPTIRTTTYQYNHQHEVTSQTLTQGSASTQTAYTMTSRENMLSRSTVTTYSKANKHRKESIDNHFDDSSSLIRNIQKETTTDLDYSVPIAYDSSPGKLKAKQLINLISNTSDSNSPWRSRDTYLNGAFNYIDAEFVSTPGLLPINPDLLDGLLPGLRNVAHFKFHSYMNIEGLSEAKLSSTLQANLATDQLADAALICREIDYFTNDDFRKGRQKEISQSTLYNRRLEPVASDPSRSFDYTLSGVANTELTIHTTDTDETGNRHTSSETHSTLSGRLIRQVDADGNRTEYAYNEYGQLVTLTVCAQSETYRQITTYAYPAPGQVKITDPNGQTRLSQYDGQDQLVSEYLLEGTLQQQTQTISYDPIGRALRNTRFDYRADGTPFSEWQELQYDDWNQVSSRTYSDGRTDFDLYDPIALTRTQWTGQATDKHATVTTYNVDDTIAKIDWKDQDGIVYQTQTANYTRAKQVKHLRTVGELGITQIDYTYDGIGRLLSERYSEQDKSLLNPPLIYTYYYTYPLHWLLTEATKIEIEFAGKRQTLGARSFDTWGRVTSLTRGTATETYTYEGANQVPASTTTAEGRVLKHEYIKELGNRLSKTQTADGSAQKTFTYAYGSQGIATASEGERFLQYNHDLNLRVNKQQVQTQPGKARKVLSTYSLNGRLLNDTDALDNNTLFLYNNNAQCYATNSSYMSNDHIYDEQGRLQEEGICGPFAGPNSRVALSVKYRYDSQHRETSRQFILSGKVDLQLVSTYYADAKLKLVQLQQGTTVIGSRSLTYTPGGRLKECTTTGVWRPKNPKNKAIDSQAFTYDALGNVITCVTRFSGVENTSTYTYDSATGCRLEKIENTHTDYTACATLSYDNAGRVTQDQTGKKYTYDAFGRLIQAGSTRYTYDPSDRLMTRDQDGAQSQIIYDGLQARGEYPLGSTDTSRNLQPGSTACTVQQITRAGVGRTLLELRDANGTVLISYDVQAETFKHHAYTAFGEHASDEVDSMLGFNGEYRDTATGQYPLGMGGRWYDSASMQFHTPDELSPFGEGGPNLYAYCAKGDPVNYQDPTGNFSVSDRLRKVWGDQLPGPLGLGSDSNLISTIIWGSIGVLTAVMTGGTSLLLTAALVALALTSLVTGIASVIVSDTNSELSRILAWVSLGAGAFGGTVTLAKKIATLAQYLARSGVAIARNLYSKAAPALTTTLRRLGQFKDYGGLYGKAAPRPSSRMIEPFPFNEQFMVTAPKALRLFNVGDANTVTFVTTGVLANTEYFESEPAQVTNTLTGDVTWLPWGGFKGLWLKVRGR